MQQANLQGEIENIIAKLDEAHGIERSDLLYELAKYYNLKDSKLAVQYGEEANKIAEDLNDLTRKEKILLLLGKIYYKFPDYFLVIERLSECAVIAENLSHIENEIEALRMLGMTQNLAGDFSRALDSQFKALNLCRKIGNSKGESESLMQIGLSYLGNKENDTALEYLNKALHIRLQSGTKEELASILGNLGNIHINLTKHEKAIEYFEKCKTLFEEIGDKVQTARAYMNIGISLGALGKYEAATQNVNTGLKTFLLTSDKEPICRCIYTLGYIYSEQKNYTKAIQYFDEAITIGESCKIFYTLEHIYGAKSEAAAYLGDYKTAYEFYKKSHSMVEERLKKTSDFKTRYLSIAHKVDSLQEESQVLAEKNAKLNELNEQLTILNNEKTEFLSIAAHDLKNPLNSISLSASTIKKYIDTFPQEKIVQYLDKIEKTSTKIKNIVTNLININIIETGRYLVKKQELDLTALIKYIAEDFKQVASSKNIPVIFQCNEVIKIITDEDAIHSILDNLISNAVKYSMPGSEIKIELSKSDKTYIKVIDSGLGIKESEYDKVFQKFARISNKPTSGENSTGLGLSIVKKLTELIGGTITFTSIYGKGTTFILELPLSEGELVK